MRNPYDTAPPTFDQVARTRQWTRPLQGLRHELEQEAIRIAPSWSWRILRGNASVAMRVFEGRLQGRIARSVAPPPAARSKWEAELAVFQRVLGWEGWTRTDVADAPGIAAIFTGPARELVCAGCSGALDVGAVLFPADPDRPLCHRCGSAAQRGKTAS
jgi:hypothetical protein